MSASSPPSAPDRRLHVFGPMRAEDSGSAIDVPAGNAQRLLAYLALRAGVPHRREAVADVLWPDATAEHARRSLSDTIYRLRTRLGDGWVHATFDTVALAGADALWVDVAEFDRLLAGQDDADTAVALDLYGGDLADGVYDDWIAGERMARRAAYVAALERTIGHCERSGDTHGALANSRRLVLAEPFHEAGHQAYLRALCRLGRVGEALAHLDDVQQRFRDELGVELTPATTAIVERAGGERETEAMSAQPSRFVGRDDERALGLQAVERCLAGRGSLLAIEGPAGIGKSRLLDELLAGARWRGATVVAAGASEVPEATPLAPLADALAPLLSGPIEMHLEEHLDPATLVALADLNPNWAGPRPRESTLLRQSEARRTHALRSLGVALGGVGPILLAIDDLHWAGAELWSGLAALADGLVGGGGMVAVAYRRPPPDRQDAWSVLQAWDRQPTATFVRLEPWGVDEVAELLDDDADPAEVLAVTGGVPFYVSRWAELPNPARRSTDPAGVIRARLSELPIGAREALAAAATIGESVPYRLWVDVTGQAPVALAGIAEQLAAERWLVASSAGYAFPHDLVREGVYAAIDDDARDRLHRQVATALSNRDPDNTRARAYHLDRGGLPREAAEMYAVTARHDMRMLAVRDAIDAYTRALELLPDEWDPTHLEIALALAEACEAIGDRERQRSLLAPIVAAARALADDAVLLRALLVAGLAAGHTDDPSGAERLLSEALDVAARLGDPHSRALAAYRHSDLMGQQGRWREALTGLAEALTHARQADDPSLLGGVLRLRGIAARFTGDPAGCVRWLQEAVEVHRAAGDRPEEINSAANLSGAYYEIGAWDELLSIADEVLPAARAYGDPSIVGVIVHHKGLAALALGDHATARRLMTESLAFFSQGGRRRLVGLSLNTIGLALEDGGELDEALDHYRQALDIARAVEAASEIAYASHDLAALLIHLGRSHEAIPLLRDAIRAWEQQEHPVALAKSEAHLALALLATGRPDEAGELLDAGLARFRVGVPVGEQAQGWLWALYRALTQVGRTTEAAHVLAGARDELERQAAAISVPALRDQFLERVPLNRAIMEELALRDPAAERTIVVSLASSSAPLGRPLRVDELIEVRWTVASPDDAAIAGKSDRRRHRIARLLGEAAALGAAPTDDDLAAALGVSRRTILRDLAELDDALTATTRRRSRTATSPG